MPASVLDRCDRHVGRNRPGIGHRRRRFCDDRPELAFVIEEFVEHALDRRFDVVGTAIAHVGVLVAGLYGPPQFMGSNLGRSAKSLAGASRRTVLAKAIPSSTSASRSVFQSVTAVLPVASLGGNREGVMSGCG